MLAGAHHLLALAAVHLNDDSAPYGRLYIANLGNSRLYLMRAGHLARLNIDHTLQNEYVFAGQMSAEEAKQLEDPEYVTRAIGIGAQVSVDIGFYVERGKNFVNSRRAFRIGQKRNVLVHKFVCRGTVEDRIDQMIESKQQLAGDFLSGGADMVLTEMKDEELLSLVSLDLAAAMKEG
jgi:hypothetical protein